MYFQIKSEIISKSAKVSTFNPFMPNELFYNHSLDLSISNIRGVCLAFIIFIEIHRFNSNSADPDQIPHSAASDLGLHCFPMSHLLDASCSHSP